MALAVYLFHHYFFVYVCLALQLPDLLLTRGPRTEGASLGKERTKRPLSGGKDLQKAFLSVHESLPGSTPRRYMSFLRTYQNVYKEKKGGIESKQKHLEVWS